MTDSHNKRAHSLLGGSTASRWINCTASTRLSAEVPPTPPSDAALQGTEAHEVAQIVLEDFLDYKVHGSDPAIRAHLLVGDDQMLEDAHKYKDAIWEKVLLNSITGKAYGIEEEWTFDERFDSWGIVDFWCVYTDQRAKRIACIVDYKYGYFPVDVKESDQLPFYAAAMQHELSKAGKKIDVFRCIIFQPKSSEPYKEVVYTAKKLESWRKKAEASAHKILVSKKTRFKVGKWCKFCPAQSICETYQKHLSNTSGFSVIDPDSALMKVPETISTEVVKKIILNEDRILDFVKACKKYALGKALNGGFEGLKVVQGPTRRKWADPDLARDIVLGMISPNMQPHLFTTKIKGIVEVTKFLEQKYGKDKTQMSLAPVIGQTDPPMLLVDESDPREALHGNALSQFTDVSEEQ